MRIHRFGGPDVLQADEVEPSLPDASQVLVRVKAASINPVDFKIRNGKYPAVKEGRLPCTLGRDASGIVERCGAQATNSRLVTTVSALAAAAMPKRSSLTRGRRPQASWHRPFACRRNTLGGTDCMARTVPACPVGGRAVSSHPRRLVGHFASFCELDCRIEPHGEHSRRPNGPT